MPGVWRSRVSIFHSRIPLWNPGACRVGLKTWTKNWKLQRSSWAARHVAALRWQRQCWATAISVPEVAAVMPWYAVIGPWWKTLLSWSLVGGRSRRCHPRTPGFGGMIPAWCKSKEWWVYWVWVGWKPFSRLREQGRQVGTTEILVQLDIARLVNTINGFVIDFVFGTTAGSWGKYQPLGAANRLDPGSQHQNWSWIKDETNVTCMERRHVMQNGRFAIGIETYGGYFGDFPCFARMTRLLCQKGFARERDVRNAAPTLAPTVRSAQRSPRGLRSHVICHWLWEEDKKMRSLMIS